MSGSPAAAAEAARRAGPASTVTPVTAQVVRISDSAPRHPLRLHLLFTLGPPLRGLWYETTAIPEIRTQAAALALRLTAAAPVPARPGTAA